MGGDMILKEVHITSAFDFLRIAHDFKESRNHTSEIEFYRGHSDKEWRLLPSIYRKPILSFEEELVNEFLRRRPDQFPESDGLFNILAKMQHYGLHTRLLDVTENPAVALYFSCCDNFNKDGEIFMFQRSLNEIPSNTVLNIITDFYIRHRNASGNYKINDYYEHIIKIHKEKNVEMAFNFIVHGYDCFSRPKIISERILRQSGSFVLSANEVCPKENCKNENCIRRETDKCDKDNIPKKISERVKSLFIKGTIHDYTKPHIINEQRGNRFIVKAESKKALLYELQTIGITKSFLFPELNNDGLDIMEDYYSRIT